MLLEQFFVTDSAEADTPEQAAVRLEAVEAAGAPDDRPITIPEIESALSTMGARKAPGRDGITADTARAVFSADPEVLVTLYNKCLEVGTFPTEWKIASVRTIPKAGKDDPTDCKSYRPICLLPVFGKVLDSILIRRIEHWISSNGNGYSPCQYGFTRGCSTVDALKKVVATIRRARMAGDYCAAVSLDISGAFDGAWWPLIVQQLARRGCPGNLLT